MQVRESAWAEKMIGSPHPYLFLYFDLTLILSIAEDLTFNLIIPI